MAWVHGLPARVLRWLSSTGAQLGVQLLLLHAISVQAPSMVCKQGFEAGAPDAA